MFIGAECELTEKSRRSRGRRCGAHWEWGLARWLCPLPTEHFWIFK